MKVHFYAICIAFMVVARTQAQTPEHYQLKIYSFATEAQMASIDDYLKNALIPKLKDSGINYVGVFKPREKDSLQSNSTYVLIPFNSLSEFTILNNTYVREINKLHKNVDYLNPANTKTPFQKLESVLIKADIELPSSKNTELKSRKEDRIYELTSFEATAEDLLKKKEDIFQLDEKIKLIDESTLDDIFFGEVLSDYKNNLMYMTSYNQKEKIKPLTVAIDYTTKRDWKRMKRRQKRALRRKMSRSYQTREASNESNKMPVVKRKNNNAITNLLFATEYSDF